MIHVGPTFLYSTGSIQWLLVTDVEMVKEILLNTSFNLGKPSYLSREMGPLLGQGIVSSSGLIWSHQRKIIAPELYLDKVKVSVQYTTILCSVEIMYCIEDKRKYMLLDLEGANDRHVCRGNGIQLSIVK